MLKYNKKILKKGNPVEVQTTQALMGDQSKRKQLFTIKAKFSSFVSRCCLVWCRSRRFDCILLRSTGHAGSYKTWCSAVISCFSTALIGAFRSLLFTQWFAPSAVRCRTALLLLCFLIVGIHASGISIPLSLLMLLGWSPIWIASLTLRVTLITTRVRQTKKLSFYCHSPRWITTTFFTKLFTMLSFHFSSFVHHHRPTQILL